MLESTDVQRANNNETDVNISLQPMGLLNILGAMFSLYWKHFWRFLGRVVFYNVVAVVLLFVVVVFGDSNVLLYVLLFGSMIALFVLFFAELFVLSAYLYLGQNAPFRITFRQALRRFWSYLGTNMIFFLISGICVFLSVLIISPFSMRLALYLVSPLPFDYLSIALAVGLMIPYLVGTLFTICLINRWFLYHVPIVVENQPMLNAWNRSSELVKGAWWRTYGILLAISLFPPIIGLILSWITPILLKPLELIPEDRVPATIGIAVNYLEILIRLPLPLSLWTIGITILYYDLRVRKGRSVLPLSTTT